MNIDGIKNGLVLDHIKVGCAMRIYKLLRLDRLSCSVAVIQNATSTKYTRKDIIKIDENIDLDYNVLGYIDPQITVNHIKDGKNIKKETMETPSRLTNVIGCKNPRCITSVEKELPREFYLAKKNPVVYRCCYCDTEYHEK